jgi:hypothetical protein
MPIVGEWAWHDWAYNFGDEPYHRSWSIDMPPSNALIRVVQGAYANFSDTAYAITALRDMRHRLPNGSEETIKFPGYDYDYHVPLAYDPAMTQVTFGISVVQASADLVWTLEFWE